MRSSRETGGSFNERREELQWLAKQSGPYAGEWVALDGPRLVAHGKKLASVIEAAKLAGVVDPFYASVPRDRGQPRLAAGRACTDSNSLGSTTILVG